MRLFGKVDGAIDRFSRAGWLTQPFDLGYSNAVLRRRLALFGQVNHLVQPIDRAGWLTTPFGGPYHNASAVRRLSLFGRTNASIDSIDRAGWLTTPFGLPFAPQSPYVQRTLPPASYTGPLCVSWALGALDTEDSRQFWETVCQRGSTPGPSLANLLDIRPHPTTPTNETNLPPLINPLQFLAANVLRGQTELVRVNASAVGPDRLDFLAGTVLSRVVPPHALVLVQVNLPPIVDNDNVIVDVETLSPPVLAANLLTSPSGWVPPVTDRLGLTEAPLWSA